MVAYYNTHVKGNFMKQKGETLGERIRRIRGKRHQAEFGKRLGVSQGAVSAWERNDKDRLPSADIYFRLATLASRPDDQAFFLQEAGLSREVIVSAANKLVKDRIVHPKEGDMVLVQPFQEDTQESQEQIPVLRLAANLAADPTSMMYIVVNKDFTGTGVFSNFPGSKDDVMGSLEEDLPQTFPPLEMGDIILLDISRNDAVDLSPFWGQLLLVYTEQTPGPRYIIGQLGLQASDGLVFTARLYVWTTNEGGEDLDIGLWRGTIPASAQGEAFKSLEEELYKEAQPQARREIRLHAGYRIVGLVVGWHRLSLGQK
jgi:transcriptional regulator with XRE-family HTH domain